jgi:hypothetical protein
MGNHLKALQLIQRRHDLEKLLKGPDKKDLEDRFIAVAREFSNHKGISRTAWREIGVPAAILKKAGITGDPGTRGTRRGSR